MSSYTLIPVFGLVCYLILLLAFLASKKNKLIITFINLMIVFIAWTLGSICLRAQMFPSVKFWFYISIDALFLMAYSYFSFLQAYTDAKETVLKKVWLIGSLIVILINHLTDGFFIGAPTVEMVNGIVSFQYHTSWAILIPFAFTAAVVIHCFYLILNYSRASNLYRQQITPVLIGIIVLFAGNLLAALPFFSRFPIDILSGVINALLIFYALYNRRLFRLTLLVSPSTCYLLSAVVSFILFAYITGSYQEFLVQEFTVFRQYSVLIIAVSYSLVVLALYRLLKQFVDHVFIRNELKKADNLKEFSTAISKSLEINEILNSLIRVISESVHVEKTYICLLDYKNENYRIVQSSSPLDERALTMKKDNPLAVYLARTKETILYDDLKRLPIYRAMWESEKEQLNSLGVRCILPLLDDNQLVGIVLLAGKEKNASYSVEDVNYLQSLVSVSSIAVKNSRLYEKVYYEATHDELTKLYNRNYFYDHAESYIENNQELSVAFISLDDFKLYNQLYGTTEGDKAIRGAAEIISGSVGEHGISVRYESKTFLIVLPKYDTLSAIHLADNIRLQIMNMNRKGGDIKLKTLTCSCGVCSIPTGAATLQQLISNADMALYNAKRNGKNCVRAYTEGPVNGEHHSVFSEFKTNAYDEYAATIYALTAAIDTKDHYTFNHSQNVEYYATELARAYGLDDATVEIVKEAALLHDIGKIGIDESILRKQGKLTKEEFDVMKSHPEKSIDIIRHLPSLDYVIPAVLGHHERYDGKGYPRGLKGDEIPLLARILCVADSFDAMMSKRSYKDPFPIEYCLSQLRDCSGTQFDPDLAALFINLVEENKVSLRRSGTNQEADKPAEVINAEFKEKTSE